MREKKKLIRLILLFVIFLNIYLVYLSKNSDEDQYNSLVRERDLGRVELRKLESNIKNSKEYIYKNDLELKRDIENILNKNSIRDYEISFLESNFIEDNLQTNMILNIKGSFTKTLKTIEDLSLNERVHLDSIEILTEADKLNTEIKLSAISNFNNHIKLEQNLLSPSPFKLTKEISLSDEKEINEKIIKEKEDEVEIKSASKSVGIEKNKEESRKEKLLERETIINNYKYKNYTVNSQYEKLEHLDESTILYFFKDIDDLDRIYISDEITCKNIEGTGLISGDLISNINKYRLGLELNKTKRYILLEEIEEGWNYFEGDFKDIEIVRFFIEPKDKETEGVILLENISIEGK